MSSEIVMPKMGYDMTEGTIVDWKVKEGDPINKGQILAEIETGKVNIEIEAFEAGTLLKIIGQPGETYPVGAAIALLGQAGEKVEPSANGGQAKTPPPPATPVEASIAPESAGTQPARLATGPAAAAEPSGEARQALRETGSTTVESEDGAAPQGGVRASPIARRLAEEAGIDLRGVKGTGPGGRIVKLDVEDFIAAQKAAPPPAPASAPAAPAAVPAPPAVAPSPTPTGDLIPWSRMRQVIGQRLQQSITTSPHFFMTVVVDMTEALAWREQINTVLEPEGVKITINDLVIKAVTNTLVRHPEINVTVSDKGFTRHSTVNLGIAVALEEGLLTPVIQNAQQKTLTQLSHEAKAAGERARQNKLKPEDLGAGTFTISNVGAKGVEVEHFTAIINPPQAAILAVASALPQVVVHNGEMVIRTLMRVTLSSDHRVIDGAMAAKFMQTLKAQLENPQRMVL